MPRGWEELVCTGKFTSLVSILSPHTSSDRAVDLPQLYPHIQQQLQAYPLLPCSTLYCAKGFNSTDILQIIHAKHQTLEQV